MSLSTEPELPPAWSLAETRRAWRKSALWAAAWVILGLGMLVGFVIYSDAVGTRSDILKSDGTHVIATVLEDPPLSLRCGQVQVLVRFTLDGVVHTEPFSVDGCGNGLSKGEQITLYVDPAHPANFVSDQSANEEGPAVLAACTSLVAGAALAVSGMARVRQLAGARRTLRHAAWVEHPARCFTVPGAVRQAAPVVALTDVNPPELLVLRWPAAPAPDPAGSTVLVARSQRGWTVVAASAGAAPRAARMPGDRISRVARTRLAG